MPDDEHWTDTRTKKEERMIPERCTFCKGTLHEGKTEFIASETRSSSSKMSLLSVCDHCDEVYYGADVSRKIEAVMRGP
ncbi:MAG: type II toxin-antitoxin system MqsA family antitoxin [Methanofollis sp.]|nr:type II toxin-antitoxin system MqsA family antitoxin [Methanofollis sp.]